MTTATAPLTGIYAIVDLAMTDDPLALLRDLLAGGIRLVQYRAKTGVDRATLRAMHALTREAGASLIVNDEVAALDDADGLHLGQDDLKACGAEIRARVGAKRLGVSAGDRDELERALAVRPDYLGVGPFRVTTSKSDAGAAIGVDGLRAIVRATTLPVAAIGGIGLDDLPAISRAGASMIALISALARPADRVGTARAFVQGWTVLR